jgi:hypothetical protein
MTYIQKNENNIMEPKISILLPIKDYNFETQQSIFNYLIQLNPIQQKAFSIAKEHLGTSFHIMRSTGYTEWIKSNK